MPVVKFIPLLSPLSYPLIKTDFQLLKSHLSFLYSRIRWWKKVSNQNFWCVYSEIGIGSRYQVGREIINAWSLKYYGTSNRRKRVASVSNTKAMREMKNSRKSALEVGEFQWARIEMFSSSSSPLQYSPRTSHVIDSWYPWLWRIFSMLHVSRKFMTTRSNTPSWMIVRVTRMTLGFAWTRSFVTPPRDCSSILCNRSTLNFTRQFKY